MFFFFVQTWTMTTYLQKTSQCRPCGIWVRLEVSCCSFSSSLAPNCFSGTQCTFAASPICLTPATCADTFTVFATKNKRQKLRRPLITCSPLRAMTTCRSRVTVLISPSSCCRPVAQRTTNVTCTWYPSTRPANRSPKPWPRPPRTWRGWQSCCRRRRRRRTSCKPAITDKTEQYWTRTDNTDNSLSFFFLFFSHYLDDELE